MGLAVSIPDVSSLVLYPDQYREPNPNDKAMYLAKPSEGGVEIFDNDRDVVIFGGSTTWHLRRRAARAVNLYFKFNDFGHDPLREDPRVTA